ncbi:hypothetical protein [Chitinophaga pinensis]|uniref:hypothetical protein n=1 Tax=Chitinophaga pinensis TaxID=79329 RepID=UPI0021BD0E05|nr:hypothetical protein [Chitinophaga pinensis]
MPLPCWGWLHCRFFSYERINYENRSIGTSVPEMMLIKAESLARNNNAGAAMELVNK